MNRLLNRKWEQLSNKIHYFDKRVWYLFVIRVVNALGFSIIIPFISVYLYSEQGVPMTAIGSIFLGAAIVRAINQLLGGGFSDRHGRRKIMLFAGVGRMLAFLLLAAAIYWHFPIYIVGLLVILSYGFGAMFMPAADALISDLVQSKDRIEAFGYQRMGLNVGWAIGPAIGGYLASIAYHLLFLVPAFFFFIVLLIVFFFIPDIKREGKRTVFNYQSIKKMSQNRNFVLYGILCLFVFSTITQLYSTMTVYSVEIIKLSKIQLGYLYSINGLVIILFQLPGIKWINRMKLIQALALGGCLSGLSYIVIAFSSNFLWLATAVIVLTFGEIFFIPAGTTLTSNWAPDSERGAYLGFYGLFQGMGRSFGPFYGGILLDHFLKQPLILWGTISLIAFVASSGFHRLNKIIPPTINQDLNMY